MISLDTMKMQHSCFVDI